MYDKNKTKQEELVSIAGDASGVVNVDEVYDLCQTWKDVNRVMVKKLRGF